MSPRTRSTRTLRLATAAATIGALLALPLSSAASAASPTVSVGSYPYGVAVNPSTNTVYVANYGSNSVSVIDGSTNTVTSTVSVGNGPSGVAANPSTNTVYVANGGDDSVSVINGSTNAVTTTIQVGSGPRGVAVNPWTNTVYVANFYANSVSVIDGSTNTVTSTVSVGTSPRGVAVNPSTNTIYTANLGANSVSVIDGSTNTLKSSVSVGTSPFAVDVNPLTNTVYVANSSANSVSVIDGSTNAVSSTVSVGSRPEAVAVNLSTNTVYVANSSGNSVSVIDGSTNTVSSTVSVGSRPEAAAVNTSTNTIYAANAGGNSVSVIDGRILPSAPRVNSSLASNGRLHLSWSPPSLGGSISYYCVSAAPTSGSAEVVCVPGYRLSATLKGLTNSTTYSVSVTAVSSFGTGSPSSPLSLTPSAVLPGIPTISSSSVGNGSAQLTWITPAAGDAPISNYEVVTTNGSTSVTTLYDASTNSATLGGLTNGTTYSASVTAVSSLGAGSSSNPVSLTPRTVPTKPRSPKARAGTKKVTLKWSVPQSDGGSAITGYQIYQGTSARHEAAIPVTNGLVTSLKYRVSSLKTGKKYYFVIKAVNVAGSSPASVEVSATAK